ncbi:MAG: hypothetical protein M1827_001168 [Pycnora praestabilis]|nr:MAG: hypothetical protein M1827_001168 [Pycnora praestabilis]
MPVPGTPEDALLLSTLNADADRLSLVQELRSKPFEWKEWDAYSILPHADKLPRLTSGAMAGSRGLGVQRVFWNEAEGKAVSIVFFGGDLSGWPGVIHGGTIATVMDESLWRAAVRLLPLKNAVTANLNLTYRLPTLANRFHVLEVEPIKDKTTERKASIRGSLKTMDGRVCVEATGLFVTPKGFKPREILDGF